jgi:prepilin peptidase CpaA
MGSDLTGWLMGGVVVGASLAAVWFDVRERRLPNGLTVVVFCVALILRAFVGLPEVGAGLAGAGICFLFAVPFFIVGGLGGGDVKLLTAFGAVLGPDRLLTGLLVMALVGAAMAVAAVVRRGVLGPTLWNVWLMLRSLAPGELRRRRKGGDWSWPTLAMPGAVAVPYGVAISAGALWAWFF